jgi:hypothetical protein
MHRKFWKKFTSKWFHVEHNGDSSVGIGSYQNRFRFTIEVDHIEHVEMKQWITSVVEEAIRKTLTDF